MPTDDLTEQEKASLAAGIHGLADTMALLVAMFARMTKVRRALAITGALAVAAILVAVVLTGRTSAGAAQASRDALQASRDAAQASRDAAQASRDAATAAKNSRDLLDTVNGLLDPRGPIQAASREATQARNDLLYCVVLIATGEPSLGPACSETLALLHSRGVLP